MINQTMKLSLLSGAIAALCWSIADMLLVGFVPKTEMHSVFINSLPKDININLALLMLDGSSTRLMWGVYIATFSVFLYLFCVYGIYQLTVKNVLSKVVVLALFIGYATSPVGHTGFAYIGLLSQSLQASNVEIILAQMALFEQFEHLLNVHWFVSVSFSALGWLLLSVQIVKKQTIFHRWIVFVNPIVMAPLIAFLCSFFPTNQIAVLLGCASLNIAQLLFFSCVMGIVLYYKNLECQG